MQIIVLLNYKKDTFRMSNRLNSISRLNSNYVSKYGNPSLRQSLFKEKADDIRLIVTPPQDQKPVVVIPEEPNEQNKGGLRRNRIIENPQSSTPSFRKISTPTHVSRPSSQSIKAPPSRVTVENKVTHDQLVRKSNNLQQIPHSVEPLPIPQWSKVHKSVPISVSQLSSYRDPAQDRWKCGGCPFWLLALLTIISVIGLIACLIVLSMNGNKLECNQGFTLYEGKCYGCKAGSQWNGTNCVRKKIIPIQKKCNQGAFFVDGKCLTCPHQSNWNGTHCIKRKMITQELNQNHFVMFHQPFTHLLTTSQDKR